MRVLFVCVGNSCRSQMAEGYAKALGRGTLDASSAGTAPSGSVHPAAIRMMAEIGIDLGTHAPKPFRIDEALRMDKVVTLCAEADEACPAVILPKVERWPFPDPVGRGDAFFRTVRDGIGAKVRGLVEEARRK